MFLTLIFVFISFNFSLAEEIADYEKWELNALRAETVIETDKASVEALEKLRAQLVQWRSSFQQLQNYIQVKSIRILHLQVFFRLVK